MALGKVYVSVTGVIVVFSPRVFGVTGNSCTDVTVFRIFCFVSRRLRSSKSTTTLSPKDSETRAMAGEKKGIQLANMATVCTELSA